jgi:AcrR family transcriptional regulator
MEPGEARRRTKRPPGRRPASRAAEAPPSARERVAGAAPETAPSARERAKAETREALVQAALAEFAAHGLDAPSLDAICARAGFTRGAFYVHFRDRDGLVVAVMERAFGAFLDAMIPPGADGPPDLARTVRRYADATAGLLELRQRTGVAGAPNAAGVPLHRILDACARSPALRARFVALLGEAAARVARTAAAGQRAGAGRADVPADAIGPLLVTLALGFLAAIDAGAPVDAPAARDAVLALLAVPGE